jgi:hypothetical protein
VGIDLCISVASTIISKNRTDDISLLDIYRGTS